MAQIKVKLTKNNGEEYEITKFNGLNSIEALSQSTPNNNDIFYGVMASSGSMNIVDINSSLHDSINNQEISNSNIKGALYINNSKKVEFITTDSEYDNVSKKFSSQYTNKIEKLKNYIIDSKKRTGNIAQTSYITFHSIIYNALLSAGIITSFDDLAELLSNNIYVSSYGNMPAHSITLDSYLRKWHIMGSAYFQKRDTAYNIIDKICKASQLVMYEDDNGDLKFKSARPLLAPESNIIKIFPKNQIKNLEETVILKNKYDNVSYNYRDTNVTIEATFDQKFPIRDENGNLTYDNIPDVKTISINGVDYVCFFINTTTSGDFLSSTVSYEKDGMFPVHVALSAPNITGSYGSNAILSDITSEYNKDNYDFATYENTPRRLSYYNDLKTDVIAVKQAIYSNLSADYDSIHVRILERVGNSIFTEKKYNENTNIYTFTYENEFIGNSTFYVYDEVNDIKHGIYDFLFNNITSDYKNGIRTAKTTIICDNYYDLNGNLVKDWSNGDMISIGDFVRIDKNYSNQSISSYENGSPRIWKVTGRNFRYSGCPYIDLELQEAVITPKTVTFMVDNSVYLTSESSNGIVEKPEDPEKEYYEFKGWFTDSACLNKFDFTTTITRDTVLYAKFDVISSTIKFTSGDGITISALRLDNTGGHARPGTTLASGDAIYPRDIIRVYFEYSSGIPSGNIFIKSGDGTSVLSGGSSYIDIGIGDLTTDSVGHIISSIEPVEIIATLNDWQLITSTGTINIEPNSSKEITFAQSNEFLITKILVTGILSAKNLSGEYVEGMGIEHEIYLPGSITETISNSNYPNFFDGEARLVFSDVTKVGSVTAEFTAEYYTDGNLIIDSLDITIYQI